MLVIIVPVHPLYAVVLLSPVSVFFFFNDTATTEIYTLSLHDALPIPDRTRRGARQVVDRLVVGGVELLPPRQLQDRKSTRLNSRHAHISYAVFCLKKKNLTTYRESAPCAASDVASERPKLHAT